MIFKKAQIDKWLKKPDEAIKCFLVYGSNEGLVAEYVKDLVLSIAKDLYDPFQVVYLSDVDEGVLAGEYNAQSLMGGRRVVVIKDATDGMTKYLKAILDGSVSNTLIVLSSLSFTKRSSLVKMADEREDMGLIECYEDRDEDIYNTARTVFVENGFTIGNEALQLLCSRLSNDRKSNLSEIDKLITYMGERKNITLDEIRAVIADTASLDEEDMCYFAASGQIEKAQRAFRKLINEGANEVSIVRALSYHFQKILSTLALMEDGESLDGAVKKMRVIFFRMPSFKKQMTMWKKDRVLGVVDFLYKCEKDCKTTNMPNEEIVSNAILQIAGAASRM